MRERKIEKKRDHLSSKQITSLDCRVKSVVAMVSLVARFRGHCVIISDMPTPPPPLPLASLFLFLPLLFSKSTIFPYIPLFTFLLHINNIKRTLYWSTCIQHRKSIWCLFAFESLTFSSVHLLFSAPLPPSLEGSSPSKRDSSSEQILDYNQQIALVVSNTHQYVIH